MNTNQSSQNGNSENRNNFNTPQKEEDAFASPKPSNPEFPSKEEPNHTGDDPLGGEIVANQKSQ